MGQVPSWTVMLCCTKSVFPTWWSFCLDKTWYCLSNSANRLACALVTPSWQAFWKSLGAFFSSQLSPSILCYALLIDADESSNSEYCCQLQRLVSEVDATLPLAPDWLLLFASSTLSLRAIISFSGAVLCDVKQQESATSVRGGMVVFLIVCTRLPIGRPNQSVHTSSFILQLCLA